MIRENTKTSTKESLGYYEVKKHEGCSELFDKRKQSKLHWLYDPREINGDNMNNIRPAARNIPGI
jgi:hypothetical protein